MTPTTTQSYTLSLHDALPICPAHPAASRPRRAGRARSPPRATGRRARHRGGGRWERSEEHTSELQSLRHLVCRLLLEKKNKISTMNRKIILINTLIFGHVYES